jgi:hypothetical protein
MISIKSSFTYLRESSKFDNKYLKHSFYFANRSSLSAGICLRIAIRGWIQIRRNECRSETLFTSANLTAYNILFLHPSPKFKKNVLLYIEQKD